MTNTEANWREHMVDNVLSWLTKCESVSLDADFLMLLGNPSLFQLDLEVAAFHIVSDHPRKKTIDLEKYHEASFSQQMEIALATLTGLDI